MMEKNDSPQWIIITAVDMEHLSFYLVFTHLTLHCHLPHPRRQAITIRVSTLKKTIALRMTPYQISMTQGFALNLEVVILQFDMETGSDMMTIRITHVLLHTWFHHPHGLMNPKRTRKPCNPLVLNNEGKQWTKKLHLY